ncbi:MAG: winged helix-turn-helix domain-containing protein [Planctomycetales bacterium]
MTATELFATKVGHTAGEIWQLLDDKESLSITEIVKMIDAPRDQIMQSIGWLARENKLTVRAEGRRKIATLLV